MQNRRWRACPAFSPLLLKPALGLHGANRLGGNSLSDLLVFGKRAGEYAAKYAKDTAAGQVNNAQVESIISSALAPFERSGGPGPYEVQYELQDTMQDLVGIVRRQDEMEKALEKIQQLKGRAETVSIRGNRDYNPGWHTALDLQNLLTVAEAVTISALERKESRGGHFREDCPEKSAEYSTFNQVVSREDDGSAWGRMKLGRAAVEPLTDEMKQIIEEQKS